MLCRKRIDNHSSTNRLGGRVAPQNKTIAMHCDYRSFEPQLRQTTTASFYLRTLLQHPHTAQRPQPRQIKPRSNQTIKAE